MTLTMATLAPIVVAPDGQLTINGQGVPYMRRLTLEFPVGDVPVLTVHIPAFDVSTETDARVLYVASIGSGRVETLEGTGATPAAALRALADLLEPAP